jgi:hypothetical protein
MRGGSLIDIAAPGTTIGMNGYGIVLDDESSWSFLVDQIGGPDPFDLASDALERHYLLPLIS